MNLFVFKFEAPIAGAWNWHGDQLRPISIFEENNVPALSEDTEGEDLEFFPHSPLLYVGKAFSRQIARCKLFKLCTLWEI